MLRSKLIGLALVAGCASAPAALPPAATEVQDPARSAVSLPGAAAGWEAWLVLDNGSTGVWTVAALPVFPQYACPEVVGLDDRGRCHVVVSYSGKWTPLSRCGDGRWLGALAHGDVDPRVAGAELYVGGQSGNVYQLVPHAHGALDCRLVAHLPGLEVHSLVAGDVDPRKDGVELLAFTRPGRLFSIAPSGANGTFEVELLETLPGRVRQALLLPERAGRPREVATVSRSGALELLTIDVAGTQRELVHAEAMGMGRVALGVPRAGRPLVLYSTLDDGRILRHARRDDGWRTETIYAGPQGPRGLAPGRFTDDPDAEAVAVFGYSGRVELLTRSVAGWTVETLFEDRGKGHWLAAAELDGRNGTDELIGSGYGGRIFMLARPPAFAAGGAPTSR